MKYFFLFIFQLCLPFLSAQATINGTLVDSTLTALPGANVVLLNAADSILVSFSNTDNQGRFQINDVPTGEYLLRCSFLGYTRPEQSIIVQASDQLLGLGELIMYPADYFLQGIEVNGHRIPIRMRGDTMVFDADAFGTGPNAVVEDLLRRLPGMTVENDGRILFRGKPVNELMVNGKPFFRGNTQIVTQNLDAAAIKNVEVFDQKSDREIVSGVEDGQEDITVNLEIKEEAKGKIFGQLYAGGGSNERYQAGGKAFRIGDRSQFGALGLFNNLNTVGFSANTALGWDTGSNFSFGGDQRDGQLPVSWGGQPAGENRTLSTGLNYGSSIGKRSNFSAAYILLNRRQQLSENQIDLFSGELEGRRNELNKISQYRVYSHRLSLDFDAKADTTSSFRADLAAFVTGQRNRQDAAGQISAPDLTTIDYSQQDFSRQESPTLSSRLSFTRRLGKAGNTLAVEQRNRIGYPEQRQESLIEGVAAPDGITGFNTDGDSRQWFADQQFQSYGKLSFTRLVSKKMRWQSSVAYDFQR